MLSHIVVVEGVQDAGWGSEMLLVGVGEGFLDTGLD
jgi:hypothetical protein